MQTMMNFGISKSESNHSIESADPKDANNFNTLQFIRAKRLEFEQGLEALLAFEAVMDKRDVHKGRATASVNGQSFDCEWPSSSMFGDHESQFTEGGALGVPALIPQVADSYPRTINSSAERSRVIVSETIPFPTTIYNQDEYADDVNATVRSVHHNYNVMGTGQAWFGQSPCEVSPTSTSKEYGSFDRQSESLPDLDMTFEPLPDEDNESLMQFFEDSKAWEPPALVPIPAYINNGRLPHMGQQEVSASQRLQKKNTIKAKPASAARSGRKVGRPSAFPQKLYRMLMEIQLQVQGSPLSEIVGFVPDGSAFKIHHDDAFVTQVLPKYFNMSSFSSFQRQLQLYNFKRLRKGGPYHHPMFHRDQPENLGKMVRKQPQPSSFVNTVTAASA